jgi:hypothetical protein
LPELAEALSAQEAGVGPLVVDQRLRGGLERALETDAEWVWVLDGASVPRPGALATLLAGRERVGNLPAPSLLAGVVVTADGRVHPERAPWYRRFQGDIALDSVDRALLPIRGSAGPALVHRRAVAAHLPRPEARISPAALLEWTTTVLRARTGYLVPESECVAVDVGRDPMLDPATAARLMFGGGLVLLDRLALVLELSERAGAGTRLSRPAS